MLGRPVSNAINPMNKSTGTISLVLLGTALALSGCSSPAEEDEDVQNAGGHGGYVGTHYVPGSRLGAGGGGTVAATPSARAGFGGTGSGTIGG